MAELRAWRRLEIRSLRLELRGAEAALHRARVAELRAQPPLPLGDASPSADPTAAPRRAAARARRLARGEAEVLDRELETSHHVRELEAALPGRPAAGCHSGTQQAFSSA